MFCIYYLKYIIAIFNNFDAGLVARDLPDVKCASHTSDLYPLDDIIIRWHYFPLSWPFLPSIRPNLYSIGPIFPFRWSYLLMVGLFFSQFASSKHFCRHLFFLKFSKKMFVYSTSRPNAQVLITMKFCFYSSLSLAIKSANNYCPSSSFFFIWGFHISQARKNFGLNVKLSFLISCTWCIW